MNKILLTTSVMVMTPMMTLAADTPREANETLGGVIRHLFTAGEQVIIAIAIISTVAGVYLILNGILGIKRASDTQSSGQNTYGNAIIKIAVGALLTSPLAVVSLAQETVGVTDNNLVVKKGSLIFE